MSFWCRMNGSIYFQFPVLDDKNRIKQDLLRIVGAQEAFTGSEGAVTINFLKERYDRYTSSSDDNVFRETGDHKPQLSIVGVQILGSLRDKICSEEEIDIIGQTFERLDSEYGLRSAIMHVSCDANPYDYIINFTERQNKYRVECIWEDHRDNTKKGN